MLILRLYSLIIDRQDYGPRETIVNFVLKVESIIFNITMPNGMIITNPDQFQDEYSQEYEQDYGTNLARQIDSVQ
jgi:hypothetical protein